MQPAGTTNRLTGLLLAGIVVAILAVGLARGQNDWHAALVLVGALLQVGAVLYATKRVWLDALISRRVPRPAEPDGSMLPEGDRQGLIRLFTLTADEALVAGAMAIAGIALTLVGNLLV